MPRKRITPDVASGMTVRELRKELGRMNKAAREASRRLTREGFKTGLDIKAVRGLNKEQLIAQVVNVNYWLRSQASKAGKLSKAENKRINKLNERFGKGFVNKQNIKSFGEFMDYVRERSPKKGFSSEAAARVFDQAEKRGIEPEKLRDLYGKYLKSERGLLDLYDAMEAPAKRGSESWKIRISMGKRGLL